MYKRFIKRYLDLLIAVLGVPFLILSILLLMPIIKYEDNGPLFYTSKRLGKNKKSFLMYKFRSMKINAPDLRTEDNETYNSKDDERLTKTGRFIRKASIDELPQIINVIKGDMSIIGPRPNIDDNDGHTFSENEIRRLEVRPGITGYNQAYFRNSIPKEEKFKNDVYYVDNMSFLFDMKILMMTVVSVVKSKNIYNDD